jgi:hypothetical protein
MTKARSDGFHLLLLGAALFLALGFGMEHLMRAGALEDFKAVFYHTRCLIAHRDPYKPGEVLQVYESANGKNSSDPALGGQSQVLTLAVYPPTTFLITLPFAFLSWGSASLAWMCLIAASSIFAAYLAWDLAADYAPLVSGAMISFVLINGFDLLIVGNAVGVALGLCVFAVWCFVGRRFVAAGLFCLAISLMLKPHDVGPVWLFFLLAGRAYRKRALQALLIAVALCIPAIVWVSDVAPQWRQELQANLKVSMGPDGQNNPGPSSLSTRTAGVIVDLQTVVSVFRDDPRVYNPVAYLVCGALILAWIITTLRANLSSQTVWLALASIVPISLLPTYHRTYDAKLLLLAIPACAMLWAEGGFTGRLAVAVTGLGLFFTGDIPLIILVEFSKNLHLPGSFPGKILTVLLTRPVPLVLLAMGAFYLRIYYKRAGKGSQAKTPVRLEKKLQAATPS